MLLRLINCVLLWVINHILRASVQLFIKRIKTLRFFAKALASPIRIRNIRIVDGDKTPVKHVGE